ncbi:MAG: radical SAM protein [Clostridia bacterium]|nr:radical SAM protein [Clostridia bacterium]
MSKCDLCPRQCHVDRTKQYGFCGAGAKLTAARAGLHFWEEPCISGPGGSGAVFFSGCNLRCVFCQNRAISRGGCGKEITVARLREIFDELVWQGADNINLVTPTHFTDLIAEALAAEKPPVPVIWNSNAYEEPESLQQLAGLVDIYLPDYKYADAALAARFSHAPDYPQKAWEAIREMVRQTGPCQFDEDGMLRSGVLIRHLILPGHVDNTLDVIDRITEEYDDEAVLFSLMSQYTPPEEPLKFPELNRRLTKEEYDRAVDYLYLCGWENGYVQELSSAQSEYTPDFDGTGV